MDWKNQELGFLVHLGKLPAPLLRSLSICLCTEMPSKSAIWQTHSKVQRMPRWERTYKKESRKRRKGWWIVNMARKGFRRLEA